ncbi:MAG: CheR family methyltransferase [Nitrospirota bacterium]|nr:CheR family methyltransferase [Nitrospirota bacterium]
MAVKGKRPQQSARPKESQKVARAQSTRRSKRPPLLAAPFPSPLSSGPPAFLIVGIGASAGGLEAMEEFFRHMPPDSGMAFVVVSHQHAGHVSLLPSLLSKCTTMPVMDVKDGMQVEPNRVYVALGGTNLGILHGALHLMEPPTEERVPLPIDYFLRSLARDQEQYAVGIILSGTGSDGTVGLRAIKAESGMTIAQAPESAKYQGMPRNAIDAGVVDVVKPADHMSELLLGYAKNLTKPVLPTPESTTSQTLRKIFLLLRERTKNDFSLYKDNTIHRRIERRMQVHQIQSLNHYRRYLLDNPHEIDALFQDLLIGVTSFFRDAEAFEVLAQKGFPGLLRDKPEGTVLRIWVAGCSTGEEVYSLAILLREYLTEQKLRRTIQIFASDLDRKAIETARAGLYPVGIAGDLTPSRLERFFTKENSHYRVKKEIRDLVVFTVHNILADAPFTKLDLLSCRNLLIYLNAQAQHQLLPLFHYAMKPMGILFLGTSESVSGFEQFFSVMDRKWKLFLRTVALSTLSDLKTFPSGLTTATVELPLMPKAPLRTTSKASIPNQIQELLVSRYAPATVVVNSRGEVVYIYGQTGDYLQPAPGSPTNQLIEMAREGLRQDLAQALYQAVSEESEVVRRDIRVRAFGHVILVDLTVSRLIEPEALQGLFLVTFNHGQPDRLSAAKAGTRAGAPLNKGNAALLQELEFTKQRLKQTVEELQTSNEELKSTNEELQSTNEELQSTNEELETSKEELQSLNEELITVNAELLGKLDALADAHDDLQNLLNSTGVATIFLDNDLHIKRFTAEAKRVSHLTAVDIGRPLADIVSKLTDARILDDAREVLEALVAREREVQATDGSWFLMRIMPYRTARRTIDGLVLTFQDISTMKAAEEIVEGTQSLAAGIVDTVREPLLVLDEQGRVVTANLAFYRTFLLTPLEVEQQLLYHLCRESWNIPALRHVLEEVLPKHRSFQDFIVDRTFPQIGRKVFALNGRILKQESTKPQRILLAMEEMRGPEGKAVESAEGGRVQDLDAITPVSREAGILKKDKLDE